jgi:hypothetical protein
MYPDSYGGSVCDHRINPAMIADLAKVSASSTAPMASSNFADTVFLIVLYSFIVIPLVF